MLYAHIDPVAVLVGDQVLAGDVIGALGPPGGGEYNFRPVDATPSGTGKEGPLAAWAGTVGTDWLTYTRERPGMSAFALEDGIVHHTYSAYARGLDGLWGMYQWLDRAPRGRNEAARAPDNPLNWFRRHDEYAGE